VRTNLEKVEELYLHTIEQQKQIEAQQKEINTLKAMLNTLLKKME
jgi:cell division protein FtsB